MTPPDLCGECSVPLRLNDADGCAVCGWVYTPLEEPAAPETGLEHAQRLRQSIARPTGQPATFKSTHETEETET